MAALTKTSRRSTLSAGILAYRKGARGLEVLLVHPGGPFWRKKDDGAWSIPKGEIDTAEDPEQAARREFAEELGSQRLDWSAAGLRGGSPARRQTRHRIRRRGPF